MLGTLLYFYPRTLSLPLPPALSFIAGNSPCNALYAVFVNVTHFFHCPPAAQFRVASASCIHAAKALCLEIPAIFSSVQGGIMWADRRSTGKLDNQLIKKREKLSHKTATAAKLLFFFE